MKFYHNKQKPRHYYHDWLVQSLKPGTRQKVRDYEAGLSSSMIDFGKHLKNSFGLKLLLKTAIFLSLILA